MPWRERTALVTDPCFVARRVASRRATIHAELDRHWLVEPAPSRRPRARRSPSRRRRTSSAAAASSAGSAPATAGSATRRPPRPGLALHPDGGGAGGHRRSPGLPCLSSPLPGVRPPLAIRFDNGVTASPGSRSGGHGSASRLACQLHAPRSRIHRPGGWQTANHRPPVRLEGVTHVIGTICNMCPRAVHSDCGKG